MAKEGNGAYSAPCMKRSSSVGARHDATNIMQQQERLHARHCSQMVHYAKT